VPPHALRPAEADDGAGTRGGDAADPSGPQARVPARRPPRPPGWRALPGRAQVREGVSPPGPTRADPTDGPARAERHVLPRRLLRGVGCGRRGRRHPPHLGHPGHRRRPAPERHHAPTRHRAAAAAARPADRPRRILRPDRAGPRRSGLPDPAHRVGTSYVQGAIPPPTYDAPRSVIRPTSYTSRNV